MPAHRLAPPPPAVAHYQQLDLESRGRLPLTEHLKYPLLGILVLRRRTLRAFEPADHVLPRHPPNCVDSRNDCWLDGLTRIRLRVVQPIPALKPWPQMPTPQIDDQLPNRVPRSPRSRVRHQLRAASVIPFGVGNL